MNLWIPALLALVTGCGAHSMSSVTPTESKSAGEDGTAAAVGFDTIVQRSMPGGGGGERREAVRDEATWRAVWTDLQGGGSAPAEPPAVDFTKEMVIVAAMETQSCVSKVTIRGISRAPEGLVVDVLEAPPAPNCICIVAERPFHAVRLPRSDDPVRFVIESSQTSC